MGFSVGSERSLRRSKGGTVGAHDAQGVAPDVRRKLWGAHFWTPSTIYANEVKGLG